MKVSVIISICDKRDDMFERSLYTWSKQTMSKKDFELVIIDDANRKELYDLCKLYKDINFQYIQIDNSRSVMPIETFLPILSNNVGIKQSKGDVIIITGPETLQAENNLEVAYKMNSRKECAYGLVYRSNQEFMKYIRANWNKLKNQSFQSLLSLKGAKADCRTMPPHPAAYWYNMAVKKEYIYNIGGVDKSFACGICAEDDDFSHRMKLSGIKPVFEYNMIGIHQDHSYEDLQDPKHSLRKTEEGIRLRQKNIALWNKNKSINKIIANILTYNDKNYDPNYQWGDPRVIINHEIFGGIK